VTGGETRREEGDPSPHSGGVCKPKLISKSNSRKSKSPIPGQGYLGTERPLPSPLYIQKGITTGRRQGGPGKTGPLQQAQLSFHITL